MTDESLFAEAVAVSDPVARAAFLDRVCSGPDQRREVEELLAAHYAAAGFMGPLAEPTAEFAPEGETRTGVPDPDATGTHPRGLTGAAEEGALIAERYHLVRVLGEGGMGTVYRAEQLEPVKRQVAVKLVRAGTDTARIISRFETERQALAVMDHPNIAKVLDGGTDRGRPFFVMELVDGRPLTDYCDEKRLPVAVRLELFVQVCQAVQHAHQKGIIHRDLKPSNILVAEVDGKPVPKVIDFGLAKALDSGSIPGAHPDTTSTGAFMGTPLYMAPEQAAAGSDIDTRADVYALGAVLYELLTGCTPIDRGTIRGHRRDRPSDSRDRAADPDTAAPGLRSAAGHCGRARRGTREADETAARRSGMDRDEVPGEGPRPTLRDRQRAGRGRPALPRGRAGDRRAAVALVPRPQVRETQPRTGAGGRAGVRRARRRCDRNRARFGSGTGGRSPGGAGPRRRARRQNRRVGRTR
jgi:hypothetical protein